MASNATHVGYFLPLAILAGVMSAGHTTPAQAQLVSNGTNAGTQCVTKDINNRGIAVGTCTPANGTGPAVAWVDESFNDDTEVSLPPLSTGQSCSADGISNAGTIIGECKNAGDVWFGAVWNAAAPTTTPFELHPLSGLLGLGADVSTAVAGYNQNGYVIGASINSTGVATPVLYAPGSGAPIALTTYGSNCAAVDITDTLVNGMPEVSLDCPNGNGTETAEIATATGLLGAFATTTLPPPEGSTYCSVAAINNARQLLGTCHYPAPDVPKTAFWPNASNAPTVLSVTVEGSAARNAGILLNNSGNAVLVYQEPVTGIDLSAFWDISTGEVSFISPLVGGAHVAATGLGDNNVVALVSEDSVENAEAAQWTLRYGTEALGFNGGGQVSGLTAISQDGVYVAGGGENGAGTAVALEATVLPP